MPAERNTREKVNPREVIVISDDEDDFPPVEVGVGPRSERIKRAELDLASLLGILGKKEVRIPGAEADAPREEERWLIEAISSS